jgi:hypothetical protein
MRNLIPGLCLATALVACSLDESDDGGSGGAGGDDSSGAGGATAGKGGAAAGRGGSAATGGTAGKATGGSAGKGSGGTSSPGGAGGTGGSGTGGTLAEGGTGAMGGSSGSSGRGGRGGASGSGSGGRAGAGGAGATAGGAAGSESGGTSSGGSGSCVENLACELTAPPSTGDLAQDCVNRINQFRGECACLPPLQRWTEGEACADQMAEYDSERNEAHAGFRDDICEQGGSAQNECPGYGSDTQVVSRCLQQMWDEGPPPSEECDGDCFQMYGHFINMTNDAFSKVACGFFTTSDGKVWAVQNFAR